MEVGWGKRKVAGYWEYGKDEGLIVNIWRKSSCEASAKTTAETLPSSVMRAERYLSSFPSGGNCGIRYWLFEKWRRVRLWRWHSHGNGL